MLLLGDAFERLEEVQPESVTACVTDPRMS